MIFNLLSFCGNDSQCHSVLKIVLIGFNFIQVQLVAAAYFFLVLVAKRGFLRS